MTLPRATSGGGAGGRLSSGREPAGQAAAVAELLKLLGKASRAHQLYLHNNPTYRRALALLRDAFEPLWEQLPELVLTVTERELLWDDRSVYHEVERTSDTLPWLLYKDGVRELHFLPGFEREEIEGFFEVLRQLRRAAASDDDAVTLLWERDLAFLRYRFAEPSLGDESGFVLGATPGRLSTPAGMEGGALPARAQAGLVDLRDYDAAPLFLTEGELGYLRDALGSEYAHDLPGDVVAMLLDIFEQQPLADVRDEVCQALEALLIHLLVGGEYRAVAALLGDVALTLHRAPALAAPHRGRLEQLVARLSAPESVAQLIEALDSAEPFPPEAEVEMLLAQLGREALGELFGWTARVRNAKLRGAVRAAADRLALAHTAELVRLVASAEPAVAREAVRCAAVARAVVAVPALTALLGRDDVALRRASAQALADIATPGALQALTGVLDDADRDVRLAALRPLATRSHRAALPRLEALVRSRRVRDADFTERMAVFEAFGSLCGDEGIALLEGILNSRSLLGRRQDPAVRACAAVALGRVGSERARAALGRAADERDAVVRLAVQRALRGSA